MATPEYSRHSAMGQELARWEKPWRFQRFLMMLYKAKRSPRTGKIMFNDPADVGFSRSCWLTVHDDSQYQRAISDGWVEDPQEAIKAAEREEHRVAEAAANRYYEERNLSPAAKADAEAKDAALSDGVSHVAEIPEDPLPPRPTEEIRVCQGKTRAGKQCSNKAVEGPFCRKHAE